MPSQYPTIQKAVNAASVNGTVLVAAGTFMERVVLNKTVHLVGSGGGVSIIDGQGQGPVVSVTHSGASVSGFTVENAGVYGSGSACFNQIMSALLVIRLVLILSRLDPRVRVWTCTFRIIP